MSIEASGAVEEQNPETADSTTARIGTAALAAAVLAACGGGSSGSSTGSTGSSGGSPPGGTGNPGGSPSISALDAARFAQQASLSVSDADIAAIQSAGYGAWLLYKRRMVGGIVSVVMAVLVFLWYWSTDDVAPQVAFVTPYVATLLVLSLASQRLRMPAADGKRTPVEAQNRPGADVDRFKLLPASGHSRRIEMAQAAVVLPTSTIPISGASADAGHTIRPGSMGCRSSPVGPDRTVEGSSCGTRSFARSLSDWHLSR